MTYYKLSYKGVEHVFESLELVNSFKAKNPEWKDVQHTTFEYVPSETKIVPESVPLWSLRSVLREKELLQQVKTSISQIQDNKIKIQAEEGIEYGNTIERSHPITLFIKSVLGLTDNQVDEIFIDAKKNKFMKYLIILFFFVSLTATAQQRITIRSKAAVDSIFKAGDTLKYRIAGTNKSVGTFAGSGGIGSLNGLTGATQTFVNETNIGISSTGTTHTLTWSGTLADGRIASAAKWNAAYEASTKSSYINNGTGSGDTLFRRINDSTGVIARLEFASANNLLSIGTAHDANKLSYNLTINQGNFSLPSIGGSLNLSQINLTGSADNQVLKRVGGALTWATDNTGAGVPTGGTTGQVLTKNSNADNDVSWQSPTGGGMADPGANGMVVRTALNTTTSRSITIKDGEGSITNADGVAGNPEIDIAFVSGGFFRFEAEFLNTNAVQSQYIGSAVASGTNTTAPAAGVITPNHPGVILIRSSTTANSGYVYITGTAARMEIGGGEVYNFNFRTPASFTNTTWRAGYHTATNQTDATDGVYFELNGSGAIVGKTANNSTRTTSATITTLSDNTWYHGRIVVNDAKTEAVFTIFDDAGTSLGTQTITTNLPASGRRVGTGLVATNSGTTATDLINIDYMNSFTNKKLTRGAY